MRVLVNIDVPDLEQGIAFYEAALPLKFSRRLFDGTVAELLGASSGLYLLAEADGTPAVPGEDLLRRYQRHWTPVHLDFEVDDIDKATAHAIAAGAIQEKPIEDFAWGQIVTLSDPFGNGFCLLRFNGDVYEGAE